MVFTVDDVHDLRLRLHEKLSKMTEDEANRYVNREVKEVLGRIEALRQEREKKREKEPSFS
jgi:hypothetical protein